MKSENKVKLLVIVLLTICGLLVSGTNDAIGQTIHEKSFEVSPGQQIQLEADLGDVRISTWNENTVYVLVKGNRKAKEKVDFEFEQTSEGIFIKADKEGSGWFSWFKGLELKFDIKVPEEFDAYIYTSGGDVEVYDLQGEGELKTSGGDVDLVNCEGSFELKTSGGDIKAEDVKGPLLMATSGGDVKTRNHTGDAEARTSGGDIRLDVFDGKVSAGTSGGDVTLYYGGNNQGIKLKTSGGDIQVYVEDDFGANAELKTSGGDIRVRLPETRTDHVSSSKFVGEINGGGASIECRTSGGDITLKHK